MKQREERLRKIINALYKEDAIFLTLTYRDEVNTREAADDIKRYIQLLEKDREDLSPLKYMYISEREKVLNKIKYCHYLVINYPDRRKAEELWNKGLAASMNIEDVEKLACYLMTVTERAKTIYTISRNFV